MAGVPTTNQGVPSLLQAEAEPSPITMWDEANPRSVLALVSKMMREQIKDHVHTNPELFDEDERDLARKLREANKITSPVDNRIRLKFWMEFEYAQANHNKEIDVARVYAGICSKEYFYKRYMRSPSKVAWMLCPPSGYALKAEEALEFGLDQLRDMLEQPHVIGGQLNTKVAELKLKIVALLEPRVKGAVAQKLLHAHAHLTGKAAADAVTGQAVLRTEEQVTKRLKTLREQQHSLRNGGTIVVNKEEIEE